VPIILLRAFCKLPSSNPAFASHSRRMRQYHLSKLQPVCCQSSFSEFIFAFSLKLVVRGILSFELFATLRSFYVSLTLTFLFLAGFQYASSFFSLQP